MSGERRSPPEADLSRVRTLPLRERANKVSADAFAVPPGEDRSFRAFLDALPDLLQATSLRAVARAVANAAAGGKAVVWMVGGHVIKTGLSPLLIRMMERRAATLIAANGSAAIHDFEIARWGATSEDVEAGLADGTFGMWEETGHEFNGAIVAGAREGMGLGEALGAALERAPALAAPDRSLLLAARRLHLPLTVHAAIGADIVYQHPSADGAAIGACSMIDFRRLAAHLETLDDGGVVLNVGSAVLMPEVFLKALTVARNLNGGRPRRFTTADLDMIRHYRPRVNVVERPTRTGGGAGYQITGHHEIMIPLLVWAVEEYQQEAGGGEPHAAP
ncbi:MAG: hypothetical protein HY704_10040 [Gemmatimonadetes bacterium]|nr:hypothetical protein [Gemmatimonadota bacterium]